MERITNRVRALAAVQTTQRTKKPPRASSCAYCGAPKTTTDDHVPPKSWLNLPYPPNLITVRCCHECNHRFGMDDEELRKFISIAVGVNTPGKLKFWRERVLPGVRKNRREMRQLLNTTKIWARKSPQEKFEHMGLVSVSADLVHRSGERLVRGLFRHETGGTIEPSTQIKIIWLKELPDPLSYATYGKIKSVGQDFVYAYILDPENNQNGLWILALHGDFFLSGATGLVATGTAD